MAGQMSIKKEKKEKNKASIKKEKGPNVPQNKWKKKNFSFILFMVIALLLVLQFMGAQNPEVNISYSKFKDEMAKNELQFESIVLLRNAEGYHLTARRKQGEKNEEIKGQQITESYVVQLPFSDEVHKQFEAWDKSGIEVEFKKEPSWKGIIWPLLPFFLVIGIVWFLMSRQSQAGGPRSIFSFGKSNAKISDSEKPDITFKDVAGCDEAKQDLQEIIEFLKHADRFNRLGGKIPKGVLLLGPPGTGKTLLAKAVAGEAGVPFFSMSGSDFVEMFVGVGASRVRDLFEQGKKQAPCIVFIDEIDAVGRHRGAGLGGGHDEREQTLNQLLVEMDGFSHTAGIILLAATNRPDVLDPVLLRPGRFDRQVVVDAPDSKGREGILRVHISKRKVPLSDDVDIEKIAKSTPGLVGADIENLVNEACLLAARFKSKKVSMIDFEEAKDKIMLGTERVSRIITPEEKKTTAYHEAGHALVTTLMEHSDPLHKVTIIPRGRALGVTFSLPKNDSYTLSAEKIKDKIAILMAGRAAEKMMFNERNTGASNDIEVATDLARKYVCEWGMSEELGPLTYGKKQEEVFLGKEISQYKNYSEETAELIDKVVRGLIEDQADRALRILGEKKEQLINLAEALLEHECLEGEEITLAIRGEDVNAPKKSRSYLLYIDQKKNETKKKRSEQEKDTSSSEIKNEGSQTAEASQPEEVSDDSPSDEEEPRNGTRFDTSG